MVFVASQKTLAYELLGLFQGATFDWYQFNDRVTGEVTSVPLHNQINFTIATTRLEAIFTAITAAAPADNRETRIGEILTEYEAISLDLIEVGSGGGGGASGARYSTKKQIFHLRRLLWTHLGIRIYQIRGNVPSGRSIPIVR